MARAKRYLGIDIICIHCGQMLKLSLPYFQIINTVENCIGEEDLDIIDSFVTLVDTNQGRSGMVYF